MRRKDKRMSNNNGHNSTTTVGLTYSQRLRERIINTRKNLPEKPLHFPDWDVKNAAGEVIEEGWVFVRALTAAERGRCYNAAAVPDPQPGKPMNTKMDTGRLMIWMCIEALYAAIPDPDDPGNPAKMKRDETKLFSLADYQVVSELNGAIIQDIAQWVMEQSGMRQEDLDAAKNGLSPVVETSGFTLS